MRYLLSVTILLFCACGHGPGKGVLKIRWTDSLSGDFSFAEKWSYAEGVYKNEFGQLSCDGLCPEDIDEMKDSTGRIYTDSLTAFYKILDTTHYMHSIKSEAWCYEWAGTDFAEARYKGKDTVECYTLCNAGTHCRLYFYLVGDICYPVIELQSIVNNGSTVYPCTEGSIKIDRSELKKGVVKTEFDLSFEHKENPEQKMYWKGSICTRIQEELKEIKFQF